jgi:hypothetical protein
LLSLLAALHTYSNQDRKKSGPRKSVDIKTGYTVYKKRMYNDVKKWKKEVKGTCHGEIYSIRESRQRKKEHF